MPALSEGETTIVRWTARLIMLDGAALDVCIEFPFNVPLSGLGHVTACFPGQIAQIHDAREETIFRKCAAV